MKNHIILIYLILCYFRLSAQSTKTYKGNFENGTGQYSYYLDENEERIKHGYFSYTSGYYIGQSFYRSYRSFRVSGYFKNGKNDGSWIEEQTDYKVGYSGALFTYDPVLQKKVFDGFQIDEEKKYIEKKIIVRCNFTNGILNGAYSYESYRHNNANKSLILTGYIRANIRQGHFFGIYSENTEAKITGQFDSLGFYNGTWSKIKYGESENVIFNHGNLIGFTKRKTSEGLLLAKYENLRANYLGKLTEIGFAIDTVINDEQKDYIDSVSAIIISDFSTELLDHYTSENETRVNIGALNNTPFLKVYVNYNSCFLRALCKSESNKTFASAFENEYNKKMSIFDSSIYYQNEAKELEKQKDNNERKIFYFSEKEIYSHMYNNSERKLFRDSFNFYKKIDSVYSFLINEKNTNIKNYELKKYKKETNDPDTLEFITSVFPSNVWSYKDSINSFSLCIQSISTTDDIARSQQTSFIMKGYLVIKDKKFDFLKYANQHEITTSPISLESRDFESLPENVSLNFQIFSRAVFAEIIIGKVQKVLFLGLD